MVPGSSLRLTRQSSNQIVNGPIANRQCLALPLFLASEPTSLAPVRGASVRPDRPSGQAQQVQQRLLFGRRRWRRVFVEMPRLGLGDVLERDATNDDPLPAAAWPSNRQDIARPDFAVGSYRPAVQVNLAAAARALGFRSGAKQARDIEPDVDTG